MTLLIFAQIAIVVLGVTAVWLSQSSDRRQVRWSSIFGLMSQPFWFYIAAASDLWGVFAISLVYTAAWARGFRNHWLSKGHAS